MKDENKPAVVLEFPLTQISAKQLIQNLATSHKDRIRIGKHTKDRMVERGITMRDIFSVLSNKNSIMKEGPALMPSGDYNCKLVGVSSGERITVVIALRNVDYDPTAKTITVYFE